MTQRQEKLIENYVRTKVRSMLKESSGPSQELAKELQRLSQKYGVVFGDGKIYSGQSKYPPNYEFRNRGGYFELVSDFEM